MISDLSHLYVTFLSSLERGFRFLRMPKSMVGIVRHKKRRYVLEKLGEMHKDILNLYSTASFEPVSNDNVIWVCWLQGENQAPTLVRRCIDNLRKYNEPQYKVIIIDLKNINDYASISDVIMKKFNDGIISNTHFSDILRFNLLMRHGGLWIDATYLTLKKLPSFIQEEDFFTLASNIYDDKFIPMGRWSGNFMKFSKNSLVPNLMYILFVDYWTKNIKLVDYFLIDFYLELIYANFDSFQAQVDNNTRLGDNCFLMSSLLFEGYNENDNNLIVKDTVKIYKLSYKNISSKSKIPNTFYQKYINYKKDVS